MHATYPTPVSLSFEVGRASIMLCSDKTSNLKINDLQFRKTTCKEIVIMVGFQNTVG
jgi:hypothetical protein